MSNFYTKSTLSKKFTIANEPMIKHLTELGLWSETLKDAIIANDGSLKGLVPQHLADIYKTVYEISQKVIIERAAARQYFIDQSQSLNIRLRDNSDETLRKVMFRGWECGLKTGSYYITMQPKARAPTNVATPTSIVTTKKDETCPIGCDSCSS